MNSEYNVYDNEKEMDVEGMVVEYTTPEQIVMLWQEAQAWKETHNIRWDEFISLVVGR
jgi:hypothetical protein